MTNATVDAIVVQSAGYLLTLKYKGGELKVAVPPRTPVVTFAIATSRAARSGRPRLRARGAPARRRSLATSRILVGKDGLVPPM